MGGLKEKINRNGLKKEFIALQIGISSELLRLALNRNYNLNQDAKTKLIKIVNAYDIARSKLRYCI